MTPLLKSPRTPFLLATSICSLLLGVSAWSQEDAKPASPSPSPSASQPAPQLAPPSAAEAAAQPEKARALLDQVTKSEQDRQIAVKQTEIDRIQEDEKKAGTDSSALQKTMDSTTALITDRTDNLSTLTTDSKRLQHELTVAEARINAERLKIEGLKALSDAQAKSLSALARHTEETSARSRVQTIEMELLQAGKLIPSEGREETAQTELSKARRALSAAIAKTDAEERLAHDAMKAATTKMTLAEAKAAAAQRLADNEPAASTSNDTAAAMAKPPIILTEKPATEKKASSTPHTAATTTEKPAPVASGPKPSAIKSLFGKSAAKPTAASTTSKTSKTAPK